MTWQLMWCNVRAAALNATLQFLVIYRLVLISIHLRLSLSLSLYPYGFTVSLSTFTSSTLLFHQSLWFSPHQVMDSSSLISSLYSTNPSEPEANFLHLLEAPCTLFLRHWILDLARNNSAFGWWIRFSIWSETERCTSFFFYLHGFISENAFF